MDSGHHLINMAQNMTCQHANDLIILQNEFTVSIPINHLQNEIRNHTYLFWEGEKKNEPHHRPSPSIWWKSCFSAHLAIEIDFRIDRGRQKLSVTERPGRHKILEFVHDAALVAWCAGDTSESFLQKQLLQGYTQHKNKVVITINTGNHLSQHFSSNTLWVLPKMAIDLVIWYQFYHCIYKKSSQLAQNHSQCSMTSLRRLERMKRIYVLLLFTQRWNKLDLESIHDVKKGPCPRFLVSFINQTGRHVLFYRPCIRQFGSLFEGGYSIPPLL